MQNMARCAAFHFHNSTFTALEASCDTGFKRLLLPAFQGLQNTQYILCINKHLKLRKDFCYRELTHFFRFGTAVMRSGNTLMIISCKQVSHSM